MIGKVIQGFFLGGQPKLAAVQPRFAAPPPIQAKTAAAAPATAFAGRPPGPPVPAFGARPPGSPAPAFVPRPGTVQRHGAGNAFAVDSGALGLGSGGGKPLPDAVRGKMEAALGADFSHVRVHVGPQAGRIGAIAFTVGSDIYFAPGRYQPDTIQGRQLLGHELAHVVQQRAGRVRNPLGSGLAVVQDRALEAEADRLGQRAASMYVRSILSVQRYSNINAQYRHFRPALIQRFQELESSVGKVKVRDGLSQNAVDRILRLIQRENSLSVQCEYQNNREYKVQYRCDLATPMLRQGDHGGVEVPHLQITALFVPTGTRNRVTMAPRNTRAITEEELTILDNDDWPRSINNWLEEICDPLVARTKQSLGHAELAAEDGIVVVNNNNINNNNNTNNNYNSGK